MKKLLLLLLLIASPSWAQYSVVGTRALDPTNTSVDWSGLGGIGSIAPFPGHTYGLSFSGSLPDWQVGNFAPSLMTTTFKATWPADSAAQWPSITGHTILGSMDGPGNANGQYSSMYGQASFLTNNITSTKPAYLYAHYAQVTSSANTHTSQSYAMVAYNTTNSTDTSTDAYGIYAATFAPNTANFNEMVTFWADSPVGCDIPAAPACALFTARKIYTSKFFGYGRNVFDSKGGSDYTVEITGGKGAKIGGVYGQLQLVKEGGKPSCDVAHRGSFWYEPGADGVADTTEVCRKDAANAYAWVSVY